VLICRTHRHYIGSQRQIVESGAEGARTPDLRAASATLFQLSYSPRSAYEFIATGLELGGALLGALILIDIED
jgi:hypothetical protein